jgi:hypothetical protein
VRGEARCEQPAGGAGLGKCRATLHEGAADAVDVLAVGRIQPNYVDDRAAGLAERLGEFAESGQDFRRAREPEGALGEEVALHVDGDQRR